MSNSLTDNESTQIYASDIFSTVFEKDPRDSSAGLRYRRTILANGSSRDELQMLVDLLGRQPNLKALIAHLEPNGNTNGHEASFI